MTRACNWAIGDRKIFSTAAVFLPTGDPRYGQHCPNKEDGDVCYCIKLYGKVTKWGCYWFGGPDCWKDNIEKARALRQKLVVMYKAGQVGQGDDVHWESLGQHIADAVGLGGSQRGEVAWLKMKGYDFEKMDVHEGCQEMFNQCCSALVRNDDSGMAVLSREFAHCHGVTTLNLNHTRLRDAVALAPSMAQHGALQTLSLSSNQLTALPEAFGQLASLRELHLTHNRLAALPSSFGRLAALQKLYLSHNKLATLPASFGRLAALEVLWIDRNRLSALPESFGQLAALQTLTLQVNLLASLPKSFGQLQALHLLLVDDALRHMVPPNLKPALTEDEDGMGPEGGSL